MVNSLVFYPLYCQLCLNRCKHSLALCEKCQALLPYNSHCCKICAVPLPENQSICGVCQLKTQHDYQQIYSPFLYQQGIVYLIQQFKYQGHPAFGKTLALLYKNWIQDQSITYPEALIPIPLHPVRFRQRGYNQSLEISRILAKQLNITLDYQLLKRTHNNPKQSLLSASQRKDNIHGVFSLNSSTPSYQHIAIVDDVVTTGSTVAEAAKILQTVGIKKIDVWSIARVII